MCVLFRTAHAIAKHGRPFTDFSWMCQLDEKSVTIGSAYRSDKQAHTFCHYIAEVARQKLVDLVSQVGPRLNNVSVQCLKLSDLIQYN